MLAWYRESARDYPWRGAAIDAYTVLVSEFMLQQTQARTVAKRLPEFLEQFPSIAALANATNGIMLKAWQGLGYNSRALRLRDAAIVVRDNHASRVPEDPAALIKLSGIGTYASASIVCFAYNKPVVVIDVNIRRVYSRYMRRQPTTATVEPESVVRVFAEKILPRTNAAEWYHAVMDLGAHICTARKPLCEACPLQASCPSAGVMLEATRSKRPEPTFYGHPNRIWRGRIVKLLNGTATAAAITPRRLFKELTSTTATSADIAWLDGVLKSLQADGMLARKGSAISSVR